MDLASPLRTLAPGLDSAVLQVLAATESGLSASQIARLAPRGTRAGQLPVIDRLVAHGLVLAEPANLGYLYRLNRRHVLAPSVLEAARARATLVERLTDAVADLRPVPVHVSLFGSLARGEGGPDSDVDLLIVSDADLDEDWTEQLQGLADDVLAWSGNRLEHVVLTSDRLRKAARRHEPVVASWRAEGQTILGSPLELLLGGLVPAGSRGRR